MTIRHAFVPVLVLATLVVGRPPAAPAQPCAGSWVSGDRFPGVEDGIGGMTLWDPDGPGPRPQVLVVGGSFRAAGAAATPDGLALFDGESWRPMDGGGAYSFHDLVVMPDGSLVGARVRRSPAGVSSYDVARWDGTAWDTLGDDAGGLVRMLLVLPGGDLLAAGSFTGGFGVGATYAARWDGVQWRPMGLPAFAPEALTLHGGVPVIGGTSAPGVLRWDGAAWAPLATGANGVPAGTQGGRVRAVMGLPTGELAVGGWFTAAVNPGGEQVPAARIALWDGQGWSEVGGGVNESVYGIGLTHDGELVIGGLFTAAGGVAARGAARWDGQAWHPLGGGADVDGGVLGFLALPGGDLVAWGWFEQAGEVGALRIGRWDGAQWSALGTGLNKAVWALTVDSGGNLIAGGGFTGSGTSGARCVARREGGLWSALGGGLDHPQHYEYAFALAPLPGGGLIAGGHFAAAGGVSAANVARWDGASWHPLGSGIGGASTQVRAVATAPSGDVIVGGDFSSAGGVVAHSVARWDGASWSAMPGLSGTVNALAVLPDGAVVAGGAFQQFSGPPYFANLARWDGSRWLPVAGDIPGRVNALLVLPAGGLIVGGSFLEVWDPDPLAVNGIALWDGSAWHPLGGGVTGGSAYDPVPTVYALALLNDGSVVAGGNFAAAGGLEAGNIARWDGAAWTPLGAGVVRTRSGPAVAALAVLPGGDLAVGGYVTFAGGAVSPFVARWRPGCPADWSCDGSANSSDISAFLAAWVSSLQSGDLTADFNGDEQVNSADISAFLTAWLAAVQQGGC